MTYAVFDWNSIAANMKGDHAPWRHKKAVEKSEVVCDRCDGTGRDPVYSSQCVKCLGLCFGSKY